MVADLSDTDVSDTAARRFGERAHEVSLPAVGDFEALEILRHVAEGAPVLVGECRGHDLAKVDESGEQSSKERESANRERGAMSEAQHSLGESLRGQLNGARELEILDGSALS